MDKSEEFLKELRAFNSDTTPVEDIVEAVSKKREEEVEELFRKREELWIKKLKQRGMSDEAIKKYVSELSPEEYRKIVLSETYNGPLLHTLQRDASENIEEDAEVPPLKIRREKNKIIINGQDTSELRSLREKETHKGKSFPRVEPSIKIDGQIYDYTSSVHDLQLLGRKNKLISTYFNAVDEYFRHLTGYSNIQKREAYIREMKRLYDFCEKNNILAIEEEGYTRFATWDPIIRDEAEQRQERYQGYEGNYYEPLTLEEQKNNNLEAGVLPPESWARKKRLEARAAQERKQAMEKAKRKEKRRERREKWIYDGKKAPTSPEDPYDNR